MVVALTACFSIAFFAIPASMLTWGFEAEAERLHAEYLTLQALRKARALTQVQLAQTLGVRQATVAKYERQSDLLLSTLKSYVEAMGGELKLMVEFPGAPPVALDRLGETEAKPRKAG